MASVLVNQDFELNINSTFEGGQAVPAARVLQNGNIIVTWNDEPSSAIKAQIITSTGVKVGDEFQINNLHDSGAQNQSNLQNSNVTVLSNGDFVVTWVDNSHDFDGGDTTGSAIRARVFHQDGTAVGDEFLVNTATGLNQTAPTVTALAGSQFVVVWSDANTPAHDGDAAGSAIRGQVFNANGTTSGTEFLVNTTTAGNQTTPFITTLADGSFVVTWIDAAGSGDILGQRYSSAGATIGAQFTIDADADADTIPVVTALRDTGLAVGNGNNNFVVSWVSTAGGNSDIHAKIYTYDTASGTDGGPVGDAFTAGAEFTVNTLNGAAGNQNSPTLLGTSDGGFVVGFRDQNFATSSTTAAAMIKQYDKTGAPVGYLDDTGTLNTNERIVATEIPGTGSSGFKTVFPSLIQLPTGEIMAFYEERLGFGPDADDESVRGVVLKSFNLVNTGTGSPEALTGTANADIVMARGGNDSLSGANGDDILVGGAGADLLNGGNNNDTASYFDAASAVVADLKYGNSTGSVTGFSVMGDAVGDVFVSIENLTGSQFADRLYGDDNANTIDGGKGDDVLAGRGGADRLIGGIGFDTADYSGATEGVVVNLDTGGTGGEANGDTYYSIENVTGSNFDDVIVGSTSANVLKGLAGNDVLDGGADVVSDQQSDADIFDGGDGTDTVTYANSESGVIADLVNGGSTATDGSAGDAQGDTYISVENLIGSEDDDTLRGNASANVLTGGEGDDLLEGRAGADTLSGGDGSDTASYASSSGAVAIDLTKLKASGGDASGDKLSSIENLIGSTHNDKLTGGKGGNVLEGGLGNDTLNGGKGSDTASYLHAAGAVAVNLASGKVTGADGSDKLIGIENAIGGGSADTIIGSKGNNVIEGGAGADILNGGKGFDIASYEHSGAGVTVDLALATAQVSGGDASGDTLAAFEGVLGSDFNDTLLGNAGKNVLDGGDGNDVLEGRGGADELIGGDGVDTASYEHAAAGVVASLDDPGANTGDAKGDSYDDIENLQGSAFADTLTGDDEDNVLTGGAGADHLFGGDNEDGGDTANYATAGAGVVLNLATGGTSGDANGDTYDSIENVIGSNSADTITGDANDNIITGGGGADILDGGLGDDSFVYRLAADGGDTINNFQEGNDLIILDYGPTAFNFAATMPELVFGAAPVSTTATFWYNQANGELHFDSNGSTAGGDTLLATIYEDNGTDFAELTAANFKITGLVAVLDDD